MFAVIRHYWSHFRDFPALWVPVFLLMPVAVAANFAPAYVASRIIERLSEGRVPLAQVWETFRWEIVVFLGALVIGEIVLWRLIDILLITLESRMIPRLFAASFRHLTSQSPAFFADRFVGSMVSSVNKFAGAYVTLIDTIVFQVMPAVTAVALTIAVTATTVPAFAAGVAGVFAAIVVLTVFSYSPLARVAQRWAHTHSAIGGRVSDVLSNSLVMTSHARERDERADLPTVTDPHRRVILRFAQVAVARDAGMSVLLTILMGFTLVTILVAQARGVGIAALVVMLTFSVSLMGYLWEVPRITRMINRIRGDATPMVELFAVAPQVTDPARPEPCRMGAGAVSFDQVTFAYPEARRPAFADLRLDIAAGERVGLVGHSGSGKSTLTKLLMRFYDVDSGAVRIDGQDIREVTLADLRAQLALVPQEPLLFHRSIAENIRYGRPEAGESEVYDAALRARVMEFADDLPEGLGTLVGERGVKLSGGQRQRIAIARAILTRAPVLVLDEATSALDSISEAHIQRALDVAMEGRTTIAIAHRLSTLRSMTRLVVLDHGRIVEDGTHEELLAAGGEYAAMWRQQSGGFVPA